MAMMNAFDKTAEEFHVYAHRCVAHMALDFERATGGGVMRYAYMEQFINAWIKQGGLNDGTIPFNAVLAIAAEFEDAGQ